MENQNPVHVFATWKVKEGQIENVLNLLKTVHDESVKEKGNLFYTIHQSNSDANTLVLFEGYTNDDAVLQHREAVYFQEIVLGQIVPLLEKRDIILATPVHY
ncbi:antibiotic biosynthesis monooxygenase [Flavobacterium sp. IR1]|nr:antibiotic biosynthesis monooxygenase [Flavobacterium sp. IR1]